MKETLFKSISSHSLRLAGFAVFTALLLGLVYNSSKDRIAEQRLNAERRALYEVLPSSEHDNDLINDSFMLNPDSTEFSNIALLGLRNGSRAYIARLNDETIGFILPLTVRDAYSGDIQLLLGLHSNGEISAVRVLSHSETPGLGDKIELRISDWILGFDGLSLYAPEAAQWTVKKDGGYFDQFTGATVTPRALIRGISNALLFFELNQLALAEL